MPPRVKSSTAVPDYVVVFRVIIVICYRFANSHPRISPFTFHGFAIVVNGDAEFEKTMPSPRNARTSLCGAAGFTPLRMRGTIAGAQITRQFRKPLWIVGKNATNGQGFNPARSSEFRAFARILAPMGPGVRREKTAIS